MPLTVDTSVAAADNSNFTNYNLTQSPATTSIDLKSMPLPATHTPIPTRTPPPPPQPSLRLLFAFIRRRDALCLLLPAIITAIIGGGVAPFMTVVVGQAFDVFAQFPLEPNPPKAAKDALLHGVGLAALELVALAFGAFALSSLMSSLWIWTGERNTRNLRLRVYEAVSNMDMEWFDTKMGSEDEVVSEDDGPVGAGGLMAKFARETDDVRMASSLAAGMLVQYATTTIACLALAFARSWSLTLVILSAVPALMLIQILSQPLANRHLASERAQSSIAATLVERATTAIATVKAFNATTHEENSLRPVLERMRIAARGTATIWGITSGAGQFVMFAMFVQGFWFGSHLVRNGDISPGSVMAVFWACLIASSNLNLAIPQLITLAKGKSAMVSLVALIQHPSARHDAASSTRLYAPLRCKGELTLQEVSFAYPSRPEISVLSDVYLFLPANEMTFIVGGSGSGKSTVAQLLLRMYAPQFGTVTMDELDVHTLDPHWTAAHVACVSQGCILFDMTVHENVAMGIAGGASGRLPEDVTRAEVIEVCKAAMIHDFIRDLPDGYETRLGTNGANLSGGQKQRLAIARALVRDPAVLILDEATSALDVTSRILVFESIKYWRRNKTTVVITHDLSQVTASDFVYVLKNGEVVEQGFRQDLELDHYGTFREMMDAQGETGGFLPIKEDPSPIEQHLGREHQVEEILGHLEDERQGEDERRSLFPRHQSMLPAAGRRTTMANWMFEAVFDLTRSTAPTPAPAKRVSTFIEQESFGNGVVGTPDEKRATHMRKHSSLAPLTIPAPVVARVSHDRRRSLQFAPTSPTVVASPISSFMGEDDFNATEKSHLQRSATLASARRLPSEKKPRMRWDEKKLVELESIKVEKPTAAMTPAQSQPERPAGFWALLRQAFPTFPSKPLLFLGFVACIISGAMVPLFSYLLSRLLYEVSIGAKDVTLINQYGAIVLSVAAADGLFFGLKYFIMEFVAMKWVNRIRECCYYRVLKQDKKWFDKSENSPVSLVQILIKDGDDARSLIATVLSQAVLVVAMFTVGLVWALAVGWQLTLVGLAIMPVFAVTMMVQSSFVGRFELQNKRAREEVAKDYYEALHNVRGIRAMALESVFERKFEASVDRALASGSRGAFVEGATFGTANALIYLAEAILFYVGAVLIAKGTYTYLQMVQVLNLCVFTVSLGGQLMAFTQRIAKATQATADFNRLLTLSTKTTDECQGSAMPPIIGAVSFNNVSFSYPERPDVPVLKHVSLQLEDSECVAIVGTSGSGKSTIAALLQRLYEPASGRICIGRTELGNMEVSYLRKNVSVVSQNPHLFDGTILENLAYGSPGLTEGQLVDAAKAAHVHDFVMSLPDGYQTMVGENASLISGGQAQRLSIARALARPSRLLILDECTSALDVQNQAAVMETIQAAKVGRTTLMITHKLPVMRMCDRLIVVQEGEIVEMGTYASLMERNGVFASLASGGEWE